MNNHLPKWLITALIALTMASCQRALMPSPILGTTDVPVDKTITADPKLEAQIAPYREEVVTKMSEVVGTAPVALSKGDYESPLGNFVVDLQLVQAQPLYGKPIDLSLATNGGLRVPLPEGEITTGNVFELMPFENELLVLTLKGETVQQLFDYAAERKNAPIGNATYTVVAGKAKDIKVAGKPFDPRQNYTLVTSNYLAGGGDDLNMLKNAVKTETVGLLLRDAILKQIRHYTSVGKPITADTTKRVTILP